MRSLFEGKHHKFPEAQKAQSITKHKIFGKQAASEPTSAATTLPNTFSLPHSAAFSEQLPLPQVNIHLNAQLPMSTSSQNLDIIDRGIVSLDQATVLFHEYVTELVPHYPAVVFPPTVTAPEIRRTKPTLFLAIIAAAAGKSDPHLYSILNSEILSAYAQQIVIGSQKSLELVQAMIVTSVWYYPPGKFAQLKFYEYIHMAATMAVDIGLGTNPKVLRRRRGDKDSPISDDCSIRGYDDLERRRTFLSCYLITTGQVDI
jgi:hypothetical protein